MLKLVGCVGWFSFFFSKKISEILQMILGFLARFDWIRDDNQ